jgi:hypothetical protein
MSIVLRRCCSSPLTDPHYDGCEVEALRVNRWHSTRDAVLTGLYARGADGDYYEKAKAAGATVTQLLTELAGRSADCAHGPLEFK